MELRLEDYKNGDKQGSKFGYYRDYKMLSGNLFEYVNRLMHENKSPATKPISKPMVRITIKEPTQSESNFSSKPGKTCKNCSEVFYPFNPNHRFCNRCYKLP